VPTFLAHGVVGAALASGTRGADRTRLALGLAFVAAAPDLDAVGFWLGIPYEHALGHRGFSHSLPFALLVGALAPRLFHGRSETGVRLRYGVLYALATASHGLLDACTTGGLGIGLWIPFSSERYFSPFRPIMTSSLNPKHFLTGYQLRVLANEALWIGLPVAVGLALRAAWARRR
jgi:inner membrane protein